MKKSLLMLVCAGFAASLAAQEGGDEKRVQMGIAYQFGMNFNKPGTKVIERDGIGVQNMIGMNVNFSFTPNIGLMTGLEFDFESFKYHVIATDPIFYDYVDTEILQKEEDETNAETFRLVDRKQKAIYATVPTMLLFRTNMIGAFRYYGKFGARTSFLLSSSINDDGYQVDGLNQTSASNDNMKAKGDLFFLRSTIGLSGGAEWNFTGNTSLFAELGFYYGFTPVHYGDAITGDDKERDMTMYQVTSDGTPLSERDYLNFSAKQKQIVLKVGILF